MEDNLQTENTMHVNEQIKESLMTATKWSKFLSIIGFIGVGLLLIMSIVLMLGIFPMPGMNEMNQSPIMRIPFVMGSFLYIGLAALYFFPVYYLYKFSTETKEALIRNDEETLTSGMENLKKMFAFYGVMMIVVLSLYALMLLFMVPMMLLINH